MTSKEYLLTKLIEECAEVQQRATKALTFGIHEIQPGQDLTNRERLTGELIDMLAVMEMAEGLGLISCSEHEERLKEKKAKVIKFAEYSITQGTLSDTDLFPVGHPMKDRRTGRTRKILEKAAEEAKRGTHVLVVMREKNEVDYASAMLEDIFPIGGDPSVTYRTAEIVNTRAGGSVQLCTMRKGELYQAAKNVNHPDGIAAIGFVGMVLVDHAVKVEDIGAF